MNNSEKQLPGQLEIDISKMTVTPTMVKTTIPKESKKNYVPGESLTEEEREKMTALELENYESEKEVAFLKKAKEDRERVKALRKNRKAKAPAEEIPSEAPDESNDDICDDEFSPKNNNFSKRQANICRKYGIKRRELRRGVERARELFVPKMFSTEKQKVILAIIYLLEFGDI